MSTSQGKQDGWDQCPAGELERMAGGLRRNRLQKTLAVSGVAAGGALLLVLVVMASLQRFNRPAGYPYGNISCQEVAVQMQDYTAGKLDAATARKMEIHLDECPECGNRARRMRDRLGETAQKPHPLGRRDS